MRIFKTRKEYFDHPAVSNSLLKAMDSNPSSLTVEQGFNGEGILFGEAVDTLQFDGVEELEKKFCLDTYGKKPTASLLKLADEYIQRYEDGNIIDTVKGLELANELKLWSKNKEEVRISKFDNDEFWNYVTYKIENEGKHVFPEELFNAVFACVETLNTHFLTVDYFDKTQEDIELLDQLSFTFDYDELDEPVECKCMLDLVRIDHENHTVEPVDLKTMEGSAKQKSFFTTIERLRYDIQAKLYTYGIKKWVALNYPGYRVLPFKWIVVSQKNPTKPYVYYIENVDIWLNRYNAMTQHPFKSVRELIMQFNWHQEHQQFQYDPEMYERGAVRLG